MQFEIHDRCGVLRMDAGKANAIDSEFLRTLERELDAWDASEASALVLTGVGKAFCAGLDLVGLSKLDRDGMRDHMANFHRVVTRIFASPRPVVSAINGHAIAGGCVLALQSDYRVLALGSAKMGLREAPLGVGLPTCVIETLRHAIPASSFTAVALEGRLFDPEGALECGLVDELVSPDHLEARALEYAGVLADIPSPAFAQIKLSQRGPSLERMAAVLGSDAEAWLDTWFSDGARQRVGAAVAALQKPR